MTELIIAEKPSAAQKVAYALADEKAQKKTKRSVPYYELQHKGEDIIVGSAVGHLYGLEQKGDDGWTYPIFEIEWRPTHEVNDDMNYVKNYISILDELSQKADNYTIATDYDIEGEVIGLNALRYTCGKEDANRMKFSTLTHSDLRNAYEDKKETIDWGQAKAGETRHKLDWFYGINLSRALTKSIKAADSFKVMSIGRVQGPALKLIVDKEREIQDFEPTPYWLLEIHSTAENKKFKARHEQGKFWEENKAQKIYDKINKQKNAKVQDLSRNEYKQPPPNPFNLSDLQSEAYNNFGISPNQTLSIAQDLYTNGVISYPRTSSQKLPPSIGYKKILKQLKNQQDYQKNAKKILNKNKISPNNGKKSDPAHPAIYPTGEKPNSLSKNEQKIYDLVVKRFLATFGEWATREKVKITLNIENEEFETSGKRTIDKAWHKLYQPYLRQKETELPDLKEQEQVTIKQTEKIEKETKPPKRYTQNTIIKELEKQDLGTKATRANIIDKLFDRGYIKGKSIEATRLGMRTIETLEKYSPKILDKELTRRFEKEMEEIRQEKEDPEEVLKEAKKILNEILEDFKTKEKEVGEELLEAIQKTREEERTVGKCKKCEEGKLKIIESKDSGKQFVACDSYPDCETTFPLPQNALVKPTESNCSECDYPEVKIIRKGKKPQDICINPDCSTKKSEEKTSNEKEGKNCPECEDGELTKREGFYGEFLGCSNYPDCQHTEQIEEE